LGEKLWRKAKNLLLTEPLDQRPNLAMLPRVRAYRGKHRVTDSVDVCTYQVRTVKQGALLAAALASGAHEAAQQFETRIAAGTDSLHD
jgi:hypothetical protein